MLVKLPGQVIGSLLAVLFQIPPLLMVTSPLKVGAVEPVMVKVPLTEVVVATKTCVLVLKVAPLLIVKVVAVAAAFRKSVPVVFNVKLI